MQFKTKQKKNQKRVLETKNWFFEIHKIGKLLATLTKKNSETKMTNIRN